MRRVRMTIGYDGSAFFGSQSQPGLRTVQDELERLLQRVAPGSGRTVFAGRTDRGVHALGQVVSVDVAWRGSTERLRDALNAIAPADLSILDVAAAARDFHARYDAVSREYRYRIVVDDVPPVLERRYVWWRRTRLDADRASAACGRFVGEHAFGTFASGGWSQSREPDRLVRRVYGCEWSAVDGGVRHEFRVVADGFLPRMVRNMVGAIVRVASGWQPIEWIDHLIAANDRRVLDEAAPPEGLVLWRVQYVRHDVDGSVASSGAAGNEGYGEE